MTCAAGFVRFMGKNRKKNNRADTCDKEGHYYVRFDIKNKLTKSSCVPLKECVSLLQIGIMESHPIMIWCDIHEIQYYHSEVF